MARRGFISERWPRCLWAIGLAAGLLSGSPAASAHTKTAHVPALAPMRMGLVRSNDPACLGRCGEWIMLDGSIPQGTAARFARLVRELGTRRPPVLINSNGGSVNDAMAMGRLIRAHHLDVVVKRTDLDTCPADGRACRTLVPDGIVTGVPSGSRALCASACSFILAAGERRFVPTDSYVGVHQFRSFQTVTRMWRTYRVLSQTVNGVKHVISKTLVAERPMARYQVAVATTKATYSPAQRYFETMGVGPSLMALAEATPSASIHWLSIHELESTRMDTDGAAVGKLLEAIDGLPTQDASDPSLPGGVAEDAELIERAPSDLHAFHDYGHVIWSVATFTSGNGTAEPNLVATVLFGGVATIVLRFAPASAGPDTMFSLAVTKAPGSRFGIASMELPHVSDDKTSAGPALDGLAARVDDTHQTAVISATPADTQLLGSGDWLTIPFRADDGTRHGTILIQRGPSGLAAVRQWREALAHKAGA